MKVQGQSRGWPNVALLQRIVTVLLISKVLMLFSQTQNKASERLEIFQKYIAFLPGPGRCQQPSKSPLDGVTLPKGTLFFWEEQISTDLRFAKSILLSNWNNKANPNPLRSFMCLMLCLAVPKACPASLLPAKQGSRAGLRHSKAKHMFVRKHKERTRTKNCCARLGGSAIQIALLCALPVVVVVVVVAKQLQLQLQLAGHKNLLIVYKVQDLAWSSPKRNLSPSTQLEFLLTFH